MYTLNLKNENCARVISFGSFKGGHVRRTTYMMFSPDHPLDERYKDVTQEVIDSSIGMSCYINLESKRKNGQAR